MRKLTRSDKALLPKKKAAGNTEVIATPRGQMKAFSATEVRQMDNLLRAERTLVALRDRALLWVALDTMLRGSDVVRLKVRDVKPAASAPVVEEFTLQQRKTRQNVYCRLSPTAQEALGAWLAQFWDEYTPDDPLFNIGPRRFRDIIKALAARIGLDPTRYSGHSTRRTRPKLIYAQEKNLGAIRVLLGHNSLGATAVYLGIEQEDATEAWKRAEL